MTIKNPTNNEISVKILGAKYVLPAKGELNNVPETHAVYWKVNLHTFVTLSEDKVVKKEVKVEEPIVEAIEKEVKAKEVKTKN